MDLTLKKVGTRKVSIPHPQHPRGLPGEESSFRVGLEMDLKIVHPPFMGPDQLDRVTDVWKGVVLNTMKHAREEFEKQMRKTVTKAYR